MGNEFIYASGNKFMSISIFLLFCLATSGLTGLIVSSAILRPVREWLKGRLPASVYQVLECYQCSGTWCGAICALLLFGFHLPLIIVGAFAGSYIGNISFLFENYLEANAIVDLGEPIESEPQGDENGK
jgi:hypothetical protein